MKTKFLLISLLFFITPVVWAEPCTELLNYKMTKLRSREQVDFCQAYQGKIILAVNTASNCGYTGQFKGLEALYQKYKDQGLVILGFPSNDFNQEFAEEAKTAKVCYINYGVTFPMFQTSKIKGPNANKFFQGLIESTGKAPEWNFYKYLISSNGKNISAFESSVTPEQLDAKIQALITTQ